MMITLDDEEEIEAFNPVKVLIEEYLASVLNKCTALEELMLVDPRFKYSLMNQVTSISLKKNCY
jgi:hypothetical protein